MTERAADLPLDQDALLDHLTGEPPDAHGVADTDTAQDMAGMMAQHASLHAAAGDIGHTHTGMNRAAHVKDDLVRASAPGAEVGDGNTLHGYLSRFNEWTKIDSAVEGTFMERVAPGAFKKTFAENRDGMRILLNHGKDPELGDKPLAAIGTLEEDAHGARYEAQLLDGIPPLVLSGLKAGVYGSSFRFKVVRDDWIDTPKRDALTNPDGLPERTIREARVMEFGPVTFPAYAGATAGVRSMTDWYRSAPRPAEPVSPAPSLDAGAEPHLEPERREAPSTPTPKETPVEYITREEKASRVTELKANLTKAATEFPGVLPTEAQARWDADTAELGTLERDIAALDARVQLVQQFAARDANVVAGTPFPVAPPPDEAYRWAGGVTPPNAFGKPLPSDIYDLSIPERQPSPERRQQMFRDNAMRSVEGSVNPHPGADQAGSKAGVQHLLDFADTEDKELARRILITGSPQYRRDFARYISSGGIERGTAMAVVGTTTTGGYMVPYVFDPTIIAIGAHTTINPWRQACRVVSLVGANNWRAVTSTAVVAQYDAEAAATLEAGTTIGQPTYTVQRASAYLTASYETFEDRPDFAADMAVLIQEAKDNNEEAQFVLGVGTTVFPLGALVTTAFTASTTAAVSTVQADILAVEAALPIRHRANAAWFLSRAGIRGIQALETVGLGILFNGLQYAAVGNPDSYSNPGGNTGLRLLGYPVWESPSIPWAPTVATTIEGLLANPSTYVIVDRVGMGIEVIPNIFANAAGTRPMGQRGIFAFWRNTAKPINADGGRQLTVHA